MDQASLRFSLKCPPISLYCEGMDPKRKKGGWGGKAVAHRFAIFRHDFSLLLLHKKRRILDYLWHSKPGRVEDSLNTERTFLPMWLYNSHSRYQIYFWLSKNMVCVCCCYILDLQRTKGDSKLENTFLAGLWRPNEERNTPKMFRFCSFQRQLCGSLKWLTLCLHFRLQFIAFIYISITLYFMVNFS